MEEAGYTAKGLAKKLGVSRATVGHWLGPRQSVPAADTCYHLSEVLNVTNRWLVTGRPPKERVLGQLTQDQLDLAEAWPHLPAHTQQSIAILIAAAASELEPNLGGHLRPVNSAQQERANRILEAAQQRVRAAAR